MSAGLASSSAASSSTELLPWQRLLCPQDGLIHMGPDGYPFNPKEAFGSSSQPNCIDLATALESHVLVILGEAGMGKSTVMRDIAKRLRGDTKTIGLNLGEYSDSSDLQRDLFESSTFVDWQQGTHTLAVVLDSLDEARIGITNIVGLLERRLRDLPYDRLKLVISSRTAAWPEVLTTHLREEAGIAAVKILELVPLMRADVELAADSLGIDASRFLRAVSDSNAQGLASNPLTLDLLLETFQTDGRLPASRTELYERALLLLCESNNRRRAHGTASPFNKEQLLSVSTRIAGLLTLSGSSAIAIGAVTASRSSGFPISELVGGSEGDGAGRVEVTEDALTDALKTGLFSGRGPNLVGFAHKSYAEFLAARYVVHRQLTKHQRDSLLFLEADGKLRIVPQLQETAAWVAELDDAFFEYLLQHEPEVPVLSDVRSRAAATKVRLVQALLDRIGANDLSHHQWHALFPALGRSKCPELASILEPLIRDRSTNSKVKQAAVEIAALCDVRAMAPVLASVMLDAGEERLLRIAAGYALCRLNVPEASLAIKPLAFGDPASDPSLSLCGLTLQACWPEQMTSEELFQALIQPTDSESHSPYDSFLWERNILPNLRPRDLPHALVWAQQFGNHDPNHNSFTRLAAEIAVLGWKHIDEPGVLRPLAELVLNASSNHHCPFYLPAKSDDSPFSHNDLPAINAMIENDTDRRRKLLNEMMSLVESSHKWHHAGYAPWRIVRPSDFQWLLDKAMTTPPETARHWAELARIAFVFGDPVHLELCLAARTKSPIIDEVMNFPLSVKIDSEEGRKQKASYLRERRFEERISKNVLLDPPPAERVRLLIDRCVTSNPQWFIDLTSELTLKPTSSHYDLPPADLRKTPGWRTADEEAREGIVQAAKSYLLAIPDNPMEYIREGNEFPSSDLTAPEAFVLLYHEDRAALEALSPEVWRAWTPNLLAQLGGGFDCSAEAKATIIDDIAKHAHDEAREAIVQLIDREREAVYQPSIIHLWDKRLDATLGTMLAEKLRHDRWSPTVFSEVLAWLLRHHVHAAEQLAENILKAPLAGDERSIRVACNAVLADTSRYWPVVWTQIQHNDAWGREVMRRLAQARGQSNGNWLAVLSDEQGAALLRWLFEQFPPESDPIRASGTLSVGRFETAFLRSGLMEHLKAHGTREAVQSLRSLRDTYPQRPWLNDVVLEAEAIHRQRSWTPPSVVELRKLCDDRKSRFVMNAGQLLDLVVESLDRYVAKLHGELPARGDLWHLVDSGPPKRWKPKDEEDLSDYIARHLIDDLRAKGIVVNREVRIRRGHGSAGAGGAPGQRTDIRIDAVTVDKSGQDLDTITVIAEVKGCWHDELLEAMQSQLVNRYLADNRCRQGLYLVGWFESPHWDESDPRRNQQQKAQVDTVKKQLGEQAAMLSGTPNADEVRAYVLDCSLP